VVVVDIESEEVVRVSVLRSWWKAFDVSAVVVGVWAYRLWRRLRYGDVR
jgi:hypothetical protein